MSTGSVCNTCQQYFFNNCWCTSSFSCSHKPRLMLNRPMPAVTLPFFYALRLPVLLHWIILTLGRNARGHISNTLSHQWNTQASQGDKETLKYALLSQPWYLWHHYSNPLPQTPTLEGICGCLINRNRNRNKARRLCPHLLYVFSAIIAQRFSRRW